MYKLWISIKKEVLILIRDKIGLSLMFMMPIALAIIIASVQNSTYELVSNKKIPIIILNNDTGEAGKELLKHVETGGMFIPQVLASNSTIIDLQKKIDAKEALVGVIIPKTYTEEIAGKAQNVAVKALSILAVDSTENKDSISSTPLILQYHPVLQKSFIQGVNAALNSMLQIVQSKYIVRDLYSSINDSAVLPQDLEDQILHNATPINEVPVSKSKQTAIPNATQHNIPAWTIFAMFFVVISLGSSIVREKNSGSFLRLKTMPTSFSLAIIAKQITYIFITFLQAVVIFSIGKFLFPFLGLPALNIPHDIIGLILVTIICGWCATSFAICIGVFSKTQEQCNGIGAISIVLFAAIGGLLVPSFAMPDSFQTIMRFSPLYWCLEAFYGLFLEGGVLKDLIINIMPLIGIIVVLQIIAFVKMKEQQYF